MSEHTYTTHQLRMREAYDAGVTHVAVMDILNESFLRSNDPDTFGRTVERLRELALNSAEKIASQRHDDHVMDVQHAHEEGIAEGERRERAAAVAHLRARAQFMENDHSCWAEVALIVAAGDIERGEHRREEE